MPSSTNVILLYLVPSYKAIPLFSHITPFSKLLILSLAWVSSFNNCDCENIINCVQCIRKNKKCYSCNKPVHTFFHVQIVSSQNIIKTLYNCYDDMRIIELKHKIETLFEPNITCEFQALYFNGYELNDDEIMKNYGIVSNSEILLRIKN